MDSVGFVYKLVVNNQVKALDIDRPIMQVLPLFRKKLDVIFLTPMVSLIS